MGLDEERAKEEVVGGGRIGVEGEEGEEGSRAGLGERWDGGFPPRRCIYLAFTCRLCICPLAGCNLAPITTHQWNWTCFEALSPWPLCLLTARLAETYVQTNYNIHKGPKVSYDEVR